MTDPHRKLFTGSVVADTALGPRQIRVIANSGKSDRVRDVLVAKGCRLDNYRANNIVLADHNPAAPIGNFDPEINSDCVEGVITFAPAGVSAKADEYCGLYKAGVLKTVSVGFREIDGEPIAGGGYRFKDWELLELSCVAVPCDPGAVVTARALAGEASPALWKAGASRNLPLVETEGWDASAAEARIFEKAGFAGRDPDSGWARKAFLIHDAAAPHLKRSYRLPIADVVDGRLVATPEGLRAAAAHLAQSGLPEPALAKARAVIAHYEARMHPQAAATQRLHVAADAKTFAAIVAADAAVFARLKRLLKAEDEGRVLGAAEAHHVRALQKCLAAMADTQTRAMDAHGDTADQIQAIASRVAEASGHAKALLQAVRHPAPGRPAADDADEPDDDDADPAEASGSDVELGAAAAQRKRLVEVMRRALPG